MASDVLYNRQWANQEVLRTITLGIAPFIPFSQNYIMEMKAKEENATMMPNPPMGSKTKAPPYWVTKKKEFFETPGFSETEVAQVAPKPNNKEVAHKLQLLFDKGVGSTPAARKYDESVVGEILSSVGEEHLNKMLDELGTPIQKGIDGSALFNNPSLGGLGFDRKMTDELRAVLGPALGVDLRNVVAIEETESKQAKEIQEGLKGKSGQEAIDTFTKNVDTYYGDFNKTLKRIKVGNEKDEILSQLKEGRDIYYAGNAYARQLVARAFDTVNADLAGTEYLYTVPLGDTGMAGNVIIKSVIENNRLQIKHNTIIVQTGGHGRLIELMGIGAMALDEAAGKAFMKKIPAMDLIAMNESVLTASRVGYVGYMQDVKLDTMMTVGADVSMTMKKNKSEGVTGLASKDMADSIAAQMNEGLKGSNKEFRKIFLEMIALANKASDKWKSVVDPPAQFQGLQGVWAQQGQRSWDEEQGEDISMSPFLFIRRKGVASFKNDNKADIY